jgi:hypothetical protein
MRKNMEKYDISSPQQSDDLKNLVAKLVPSLPLFAKVITLLMISFIVCIVAVIVLAFMVVL